MSKQTSAESLRRIAVLFTGLSEAADDLEKVGSVEGALEELTKQKETAAVHLNTVRAEITEAEAYRDSTLAGVEKIKQQATEAMETQLETARREAAQILESARAEAVKAAEGTADAYEHDLESLRQEKVKATDALEAVREETRRAKEEAAEAEALRNRAQAGLDEVNDKLAALTAGAAR